MRRFSSVILQWTEQLSLLISSQVSIRDALYLLSLSSPHPRMQAISHKIYESILNGSTFSQAIKSYATLFDDSYFQLVLAGENSGKLAIILQRICIHKKRREELRSEFIKILLYPAFVLLSGVFVLTILLVYAVPQIANVFIQFNQPLPAITLWVLKLSDIMQYYSVFIILAGFLFFGLLWIFYTNMPSLRISISAFLWNRRIGILAQYQTVILFCSTLSLLLSSNIPIIQALDSSIKVLPYAYARLHLQRALLLIEKGHSFHHATRETLLFPELALHLWKMGEYTGKLSQLLDDTALYYQHQLRKLTERFMVLIEPILLLVLGALIGFIVIAMYLPLFNVGLMTGH